MTGDDEMDGTATARVTPRDVPQLPPLSPRRNANQSPFGKEPVQRYRMPSQIVSQLKMKSAE